MLRHSWSVWTTPELADEAAAHFERELLDPLRGVEGCTATMTVRRPTGSREDPYEVRLTSMWTSQAALRAALGDDWRPPELTPDEARLVLRVALKAEVDDPEARAAAAERARAEERRRQAEFHD
ncbi:antibiotic biosynthesis monooxygenase [Streptomonospora sp. S1-112]|uniref:Antibiotic biosynthesis monooxygenase n=1 Tax=Streptomonospora mangrovi TaxID=2883123 RepID=A0A9X3NKR6_9ACTN|nr:hypothetical protein [Streptomonospora mangrovi]MDA0565507.1 antibiotic biosynthesis monooxygenase [Streptomonospora mangrovi]